MTDKLAKVELHTGRHCLMVAGVIVAIEGDLCRDEHFPRCWDQTALEHTAHVINAAAERAEAPTIPIPEAHQKAADRFSKVFTEVPMSDAEKIVEAPAPKLPPAQQPRTTPIPGLPPIAGDGLPTSQPVERPPIEFLLKRERRNPLDTPVNSKEQLLALGDYALSLESRLQALERVRTAAVELSEAATSALKFMLETREAIVVAAKAKEVLDPDMTVGERALLQSACNRAELLRRYADDLERANAALRREAGLE